MPPAHKPLIFRRICARAYWQMPTARCQSPARPVPQNPTLRQRVGMWLSGWAAPSLAGGLTAAAAGFWFGVVAPMPVAALDAPLWLQDALGYFDAISTPIVGLDDPLLWGF